MTRRNSIDALTPRVSFMEDIMRLLSLATVLTAMLFILGACDTQGTITHQTTTYLDMGSGTGDGNPALVVALDLTGENAALAGVEALRLDVSGITLHPTASCTGSGVSLPSRIGAVTLDLLSDKDRRLRFEVDRATDYCAITMDLGAGGGAFTLDATLAGGGRLLVSLPLYQALTLSLDGGASFSADTTLVAVLDLDALLPADLLSRIPAVAGVRTVNSESDEELFYDFNDAVSRAFALYRDVNNNGQADASEVAATAMGHGDPHGLRCPDGWQDVCTDDEGRFPALQCKGDQVLVCSVLRDEDGCPQDERFDRMLIDCGLSSQTCVDGQCVASGQDGDVDDADWPMEGDQEEAPSEPCLLVSTPTLTFSNVTPGNYAARELILSNPCTANLTISNLAVTGSADFSVDAASLAALPLVLAPAQNHTLTVTYTPADFTNDTATLVITSDWPGHPTVEVSLQGWIYPGIIEVTPDSADFGQKAAGSSSALTVTVRNTDIEDLLVVNDIALTPASDLAFAVVLGQSLPVYLQPGDSYAFEVRFTPPAIGSYAGAVSIASNDASTPVLEIPLSGEGIADGPVTDTFTQKEKLPVDILFVLDCSGSMAEEQAALAAMAAGLAASLNVTGADVQAAVTSMDMETSGLQGAFTGDPGVIQLGRGSQLSEEGFAQALAARFDLGTVCSASEQGFDTARAALSEPLRSGANAGFLRDGARLVLVFITDEEEQSVDDVSTFVSFFKGLKPAGTVELLHALAVVGDCPDGCSSADGEAAAGCRYTEVANELGGSFRSVCSMQDGGVAADLGVQSRLVQTQFFLSSTPQDVAGMVVKINDSAVTAHWSYDAASNSVIFEATYAPAGGDVVTVTYE